MKYLYRNMTTNRTTTDPTTAIRWMKAGHRVTIVEG